MTGKPASPLGRVGMETDELCFCPEEAEVADEELVEVEVGAALISDAGDCPLKEELVSTIFFLAAAVETVLLAEEPVKEDVTEGASVLEDDIAVVDDSGPLPSTIIHTIEQSSSSSLWVMGAANATAKKKAKIKDVFIL